MRGRIGKLFCGPAPLGPRSMLRCPGTAPACCGLHLHRSRAREMSLGVPSEYTLVFNRHIAGHYTKMKK